MKNNTTEPNSGNKRPNVFLHYTAAAVILMLTSSTVNPEAISAYALPPGGIVSASTKETIVPGESLGQLLGTRPATLREYSLEMQVEQLEAQLEKADERIDKKIAQLDAEFEKYETVDALIEKLYTYVGKTPYVMSGNTPSAWDCSGLTMWFYEKYKGITLEHSASKQADLGQKVDAPIPGDIVAFYYAGRKSSFHVGIYVGGGRFIHAKNRSEDTVLETVDGFAKKNIKVAYIRY